MPIPFTCPHCFKKTLVEETYIGQTGPCASCGKTVTIPEPVKPRFGQTESAQPSTPQRPSEVQSPTALRNPVIRKLVLALATAVGLLVLGVVGWKSVGAISGLSVFERIRERSDRAQCMNNLSRIARALNQYAATHGEYPPPVTYDKDGKPMHSWRVLILQELGEFDLHNRYNFDEPWDSENNASLVASQCPRVFVSPGRADHRYAAESNYFLVVGEGTLFPSKGPMSAGEVSDGISNTLLVVEAQNTTHEWTKPIDVDFRNLKGTPSSVGIGGTHNGGFTVSFADGTSGWIPNDTPSELIRSMVTPRGGESVDATPFTRP